MNDDNDDEDDHDDGDRDIGNLPKMTTSSG